MLERGQQDVSTQLRASATPEQWFSSTPAASSMVRLRALLDTSVWMLCIALFWPRSGFAQQIDGSSEAREVVHGTVVNKLTHDPISRALVYSSDQRWATLTDSEGHFEFRVPRQDSPETNGGFTYNITRQKGFHGENSFWLAARKPGYLEDSVSRHVPIVPGVESTILLIPEAIIQGRLLVSDSAPSPAISVQLFKRQVTEGRSRWIGRGAVHTNSSGDFRFPELGPGEYKIMTLEQLDDPEMVIPGGRRYGFPPSCFPGVPDFSSGTLVQLSMGQTFDASMTLTPQPYFPVTIPVAGGDPTMLTNVSVFSQTHPGPGYSLGYNPNRRTIEGLLPNGTYLVEANSFGSRQATGMVTITVAGRELEGPILAVASTSPIPVDVREEFSAAGRTGTSTSIDGQRNFRLRGPRSYLQVYLEPAEDFSAVAGGTLRPPTSPDDQALEITDVLPGRYWVHVHSSRGYPASVTSGDLDLRQQPLVVTLAGNPSIEITVRDDSAKIEGTVATTKPGGSDANGSLGGQWEIGRSAWIYCVPVPGSGGEFQELSLTSEGRFSSPPMAPGVYRVLAFEAPQPELAYHDSQAMRAYDTLGQVVNLAAGQTVHVELDPIPVGE